MALFTISGKTLKPINEKKIELEKHLQTLTEQNLEQVFGLQFVSTEFERNNLRIDTLAFDTEANAFVIIEYKRDRSFSVIDQGYAYLALLLNNKAEFILEYNERTGKTLHRDSIDWSQSRVLFVARSFTVHQQQAINFKDLPIELWEVQQYDNSTILYNQLKPQETSASIKTISKQSNTIQKVNSEVKVYGVHDHFVGREGAYELYENLRDKLTATFPGIQENPRAKYIGFSLRENGTDTLVYVWPKADRITLDMPRFRPKDISDPLGRVTYQKNSYERMNTPVSVLSVQTEDDVDYALAILKQSRQKFFK